MEDKEKARLQEHVRRLRSAVWLEMNSLEFRDKREGLSGDEQNHLERLRLLYWETGETLSEAIARRRREMKEFRDVKTEETA